MYYDGRLQIDPKPLYEPNPNNEVRVDVYANAHPYEMRGTLSVITQYNNPDKDDSFWLYLPALRRVRRLSAAQRTDRLPGGQDLMWENFDVFNGNPHQLHGQAAGPEGDACRTQRGSQRNMD